MTNKKDLSQAKRFILSGIRKQESARKIEMDKLDQIKQKFNYWNNRGKSAICRYILQELGISAEQFVEYTKDWIERKLVRTSDNLNFKVIID